MEILTAEGVVMRDIRFRAWHKGQMYYDVGLLNGHVIPENWHEYDCAYHPDDAMLVPEFVMQFTGIQDKNGKDIYEGDIIEAPHDFGLVGTEIRRFAAHFNVELGSYQWNYWHMDEAEIIGDIHTTPGLLEQ